jgi:glyoxylase-like metal-dependent hydrolase (beta-lactamase superfamily II)
VGGRELQVLYAPGHAPHHIVVFDRETRGLFCGEALGLPGRGAEPIPLPAVAPPSFDQELCLETMETLRKLDARLLFFSHGGVGSNPEKLISVASENTRVLGDLILRSLKEGETAEAIGGRVKEFASSRYGLDLNDGDALMTVGGYSLYFQSKGLV